MIIAIKFTSYALEDLCKGFSLYEVLTQSHRSLPQLSAQKIFP